MYNSSLVTHFPMTIDFTNRFDREDGRQGHEDKE
ncbi:unannotated protein [freshwater metagenome]|uniref:Unannotated protein n=1 Tax=freshwater metagenome TaxID=449393 RepID=A0A6J7GT01_9ZZZZ